MLTQPLNHPYSAIDFRAAAALSNSWSILPFLSAGCFHISQLSETEAGHLSLLLGEVVINALPQHLRGYGLCFPSPSGAHILSARRQKEVQNPTYSPFLCHFFKHHSLRFLRSRLGVEIRGQIGAAGSGRKGRPWGRERSRDDANTKAASGQV